VDPERIEVVGVALRGGLLGALMVGAIAVGAVRPD
jgi:hypothetical protein